jgi:hypothetical protein
MNVGDKVIAVGAGRKTKELNGGDISRPEGKIPGFMGLVVDQTVMTVESLNGDTVSTPYYKFHVDDLHLVDVGRASVPLANTEMPRQPTPTVELNAGTYTLEELQHIIEDNF